MFGKKGQEEAPFALFLAAAMLAILIPIIVTMYNNFLTMSCEQELQNSMETLARELEIATGLTGNGTMIRVDFASSSCGDVNPTNFTIRYFGTDECIRQCQVGTCRVIIARGEKDGEATTLGNPVCVRIPPEISFETGGCGTIEPLGTYHDVYMSHPLYGKIYAFEPKAYNLVFLKQIDPITKKNIFRICCVGDDC